MIPNRQVDCNQWYLVIARDPNRLSKEMLVRMIRTNVEQKERSPLSAERDWSELVSEFFLLSGHWSKGA